MCVCGRESEREREWVRDREIERDRERECVCVCEHTWAREGRDRPSRAYKERNMSASNPRE